MKKICQGSPQIFKIRQDALLELVKHLHQTPGSNYDPDTLLLIAEGAQL